jgi:hypothetical protein
VHEIETGEAGASDDYIDIWDISIWYIDIWRDDVRILRPSVV